MPHRLGAVPGFVDRVELSENVHSGVHLRGGKVGRVEAADGHRVLVHVLGVQPGEALVDLVRDNVQHLGRAGAPVLPAAARRAAAEAEQPG